MKPRFLIIIGILMIAVPLQSFAEDSSEYHVGVIQWLETSYPVGGTAVVRVVDPDMNLNPEKIDNFDVFVQSDSHTKGLFLTMTETGVSTGIFDGTLFLPLNHEAVGHRLKVAEGDTITAEYYDNTLPASYTEDMLRVIAKSEIHPTLESTSKQIKSEISVVEKQVRYNIPYVISHGTIDNMSLFCERGSLLIDVSSQSKSDVHLDIEIPRNLLDPKTDGEDSRFSILRDGDEIDYDEIPYKDHRKLSISFPPTTEKIEFIHAFIPVSKPPMCKVADSPPYSVILSPLEQFNSGIPTNQIQCREGLTMLLSPKDSRPVCVTGDTAEKLIQRHWAILVSRG